MKESVFVVCAGREEEEGRTCCCSRVERDEQSSFLSVGSIHQSRVGILKAALTATHYAAKINGLLWFQRHKPSVQASSARLCPLKHQLPSPLELSNGACPSLLKTKYELLSVQKYINRVQYLIREVINSE